VWDARTEALACYPASQKDPTRHENLLPGVSESLNPAGRALILVSQTNEKLLEEPGLQYHRETMGFKRLLPVSQKTRFGTKGKLSGTL
jgi:hypothetical protein